jgi:hypothetical protein
MVRHHGKVYDWKHAPIDATVVLGVAERLINGEIIIIFVLYFDVSFKYTLKVLDV